MKIKVSERILVIGDSHSPVEHPNYLDFLIAVRKYYSTKTTIHIGDVVDFASISYHEKEFGCPSPEQEVEIVRDNLAPWRKAFPKMFICQGNHDSLPVRKLKSAGLPPQLLKNGDINDLIAGPKGWLWANELEFTLGCGVPVVASHKFSGSVQSFSKMADVICLIQGHFHEMAGVWWSKNPHGKTFAMATGCGINPDSPAFNYRKEYSGRAKITKPLLGCGIIINGAAFWLPMWTDKRGCWTGEVP